VYPIEEVTYEKTKQFDIPTCFLECESKQSMQGEMELVDALSDVKAGQAKCKPMLHILDNNQCIAEFCAHDDKVRMRVVVEETCLEEKKEEAGESNVITDEEKEAAEAEAESKVTATEHDIPSSLGADGEVEIVNVGRRN